MHGLPHCQHSPPECCICYTWWTYSDSSLSPKVHSLHIDSLLVLYSGILQSPLIWSFYPHGHKWTLLPHSSVAQDRALTPISYSDHNSYFFFISHNCYIISSTSQKFPSLWVLHFLPIAFRCILKSLLIIYFILVFRIFNICILIIFLICQAELFIASVSLPAQFSESNWGKCRPHADCSY